MVCLTMTSVGSVLREAAGAQAAVAAAVIVVVLLVVCVGAACILACSASKVFAHGVGLHSIKKHAQQVLPCRHALRPMSAARFLVQHMF